MNLISEINVLIGVNISSVTGRIEEWKYEKLG